MTRFFTLKGITCPLILLAWAVYISQYSFSHAQVSNNSANPLGTITESGDSPSTASDKEYADLVSMADNAQLVIRATIRKQATLDPERAPDVPPDKARLYIEAQTQSLLSGSVPIGESLHYLVDVQRDVRGRVPKLKKQQVVVFARTVPGHPQDLQLVAPDAQLPWSIDLEARLRPILQALVAPDAPPHVTGVRDAFTVDGNLAGESETQIFLETAEGTSASITVLHRPGRTPQWGVSWSELVDQSALPPQPGTLGWYRLACFLPAELPVSAILGGHSPTASRAAADYRYVMEQLGPCRRSQR